MFWRKTVKQKIHGVADQLWELAKDLRPENREEVQKLRHLVGEVHNVAARVKEEKSWRSLRN